MFGYIKTDFPNLYIKDTVLYRSMYCGLCKGIGASCGVKGRLSLNYDLTFLSVLLHNLLGEDVKIEKQRCIMHWFTTRPVAVPDDLTKKLGALNVILAYHKLNDDVLDSGKSKLKRQFFKSSFKKAKKQEPELNEIVEKDYKTLLDYEKQEGDSVDIAADSFGNMLRDIVGLILKEKATENALEMSYSVGKWIYLIDAVDDFDKDKKSGSYNVFVNYYKDCISKEELLKKYKKDVEFIFFDVLNKIKECALNLDYKFNHDLTDNVLLLGLKAQTINILENIKCKKTTKF